MRSTPTGRGAVNVIQHQQSQYSEGPHLGQRGVRKLSTQHHLTLRLPHREWYPVRLRVVLVSPGR